jgi:tetratricopeptide (TPR) repeat protein
LLSLKIERLARKLRQDIVIFLALSMHRIFFAVCISVSLLSCNNDEAVHPLSMPPYDKLTDSINKDPKNSGLYFRRGQLLSDNDQPVFAEKDYRRAWELEPKEEYAVKLVQSLKSKSPDSAIVFLESALKKLPGNVFLEIGLANGLRQKKQYDKSLTICEDIIARYPNAVDAYMLKSGILKEQNKTAEALATLQHAYAYAPGDVELVHTLAFDLAEAKNPRVLVIADSLIKADTEKSHAEPYFFKGVYYSNTGNTAEALRQFDEAIHHDYNFLSAYINKGIIYYDQKKFEEAIKIFSLANTVSPDEADPYYWTAKTQEAMGNKAEAKTNYQRAYGLDKTMIKAKEAADRL